MPTRRMSVVVCAAALMVMGAVRSGGEPVGLPVADSAETRFQGELQFASGCFLGDDSVAFYGIREGYSLTEHLFLFLDVGLANVGTDKNIGLQFGALYAFDRGDAMAMAWRLAAYGVDTGTKDVRGGKGQIVMGGATPLRGLDLYGALGVAVEERAWSANAGTARRTALHPALNVGFLIAPAHSFSIFLEGEYTDRPFVSLGIRIR